jgi:hypothetical protein
MRVWLLFCRQGKVQDRVDDYRLTTFDEKVVHIWLGGNKDDPDHRFYAVEVVDKP